MAESFTSFGDRIKELRKRQHMTQRELADALGVNFTYISKIENGKVRHLPSEDLIRHMAHILEVNAEDLLDLSGKIDGKRLQQIALDNPVAAVILRKMQSGNLTKKQWDKIKRIVMHNKSPAWGE